MKIRYFVLLLLAFSVSARAQTPPQILAELFCSFGCGNCPGPDETYYNFVSANPSYGIVVINYHNQIVSGLLDKFYKESQTDVDTRDGSGYYNVSADPAAFIDGYVSLSSPSIEWENDTKTDHGFPPLTSLSPKASIGTDGLIHITFSATGPSKGPSLVRIALKESNIIFNNTYPPGYGNPPGDTWNDVFRAMLPNSSDTTALGPGETRSFDVVYDPGQYLYSSDWNTQNMEAVVFVQDVASDQGNGFDVESLGVVSLASEGAVAQSPEASATSIRVAGIPSNPELIISLQASNRASIAISDMLGRSVRMIPEVSMPAGETSVDMSGSSLPAGCYFARLLVNGQDADNAKFIVAP